MTHPARSPSKILCLEKKRILIIDDDTAVASITADIVRTFGHLAVIAWDEPTALKLWSETNGAFDLVIIDYRLGSGSGASLTVKLGKDKPNVPFILMSGMSEDDVDLPKGRVHFLAKPFSVESLKRKVAQLLG